MKLFSTNYKVILTKSTIVLSFLFPIDFEERNDDYDYHNYAFASLAVKPKSITATVRF